jgi:hypothetical protein
VIFTHSFLVLELVLEPTAGYGVEFPDRISYCTKIEVLVGIIYGILRFGRFGRQDGVSSGAVSSSTRHTIELEQVFLFCFIEKILYG